MIVLAERIIAYLKTDEKLVDLLSDSNSIFAIDSPVEKKKYIVVDTGIGKVDSSIPLTDDKISVIACVKRSVSDSLSLCLAIAKQIDTLLNKKENLLATTDYNVISFYRNGGSAITYDDKLKEYWMSLDYNYMITE